MLREIKRKNKEMVEKYLREQDELVQLFDNEVKKVHQYVSTLTEGKKRTEINIEIAELISKKFGYQLIKFDKDLMEFDVLDIRLNYSYKHKHNEHICFSILVECDFELLLERDDFLG